MTKTTSSNVQFHVFCDASEQAYTDVIYLRIEAEYIQVAFLVSKTRVSPLGQLHRDRTHGRGAEI
jgi:hypothetical protein